MLPLDAVRQMMKEANLSPSNLSRRVGKSRTYISTALAHNSTPKTDTLARIAHECGYKLILEGNGNRIELYSEEDSARRMHDILSEIKGSLSPEAAAELARRISDDPSTTYVGGGDVEYSEGETNGVEWKSVERRG